MRQQHVETYQCGPNSRVRDGSHPLYFAVDPKRPLSPKADVFSKFVGRARFAINSRQRIRAAASQAKWECQSVTNRKPCGRPGYLQSKSIYRCSFQPDGRATGMGWVGISEDGVRYPLVDFHRMAQCYGVAH